MSGVVGPRLTTVIDPLFKMTIDTTKPGISDSQSFQLDFGISSAVNFTVDWGDGNSDVITSYNQAERLHTYDAQGTYQITLSGSFDYFKIYQ